MCAVFRSSPLQRNSRQLAVPAHALYSFTELDDEHFELIETGYDDGSSKLRRKCPARLCVTGSCVPVLYGYFFHCTLKYNPSFPSHHCACFSSLLSITLG